MADVIKTVSQNTKKLLKMAAAEVFDECHFFRESDKVEESAFKPDATGHSPGSTVSVRIPTQWLVKEDGFDITGQIQDAKEQSTDLTLDITATIPFDLTSEQLAYEIDIGDVYERFVQPAALDMAANIEGRFLQRATQLTPNWVGTAGATIVDPDTVMSGGELMDMYLAPNSQRNFLMDSASMRSAVNANKNLFTFKRKEFDEAFIGNALNFDWFKSQLIYRHTNGNDVTGIGYESSVVAPAEGQITIGLDGFTANTGTLTKGSKFTIDGVYAVHPQRKTAYPQLKQFTHVGADQTANASGQITATLSANEALYASATDSRKNVSALPADEAAVTVLGVASTTYTQSLQFHKKAFRVCSVPLAMPKKAEIAEQVTEQGITLALIRDFDVLTRKWITRLDFLGGIVPVRQRHGVVVTN